MGKFNRIKNALSNTDIEREEATDAKDKLEKFRRSDDKPLRKTKWINRTRVLTFCARKIGPRDRHLLNDLIRMMPHSKTESKIPRKEVHKEIQEICVMKNCQRVLYFETRKKKDLYMWVGCVPNGPSANFLVHSAHTIRGLKFTGNCLMHSRPLLSFSKDFDDQLHLKLLKEMFISIFGVPNQHPRSQPFVDHVLTFNFNDEKIFLRNYQIVNENGELSEIGPRFTLQLNKIFAGNFTGNVIYTNPQYVNPNVRRCMANDAKSNRSKNKTLDKAAFKARQPTGVLYTQDEDGDVFNTYDDRDSTSDESDY